VRVVEIVGRHPCVLSAPLARADVLTATEASALLGMPRSTLYDLARRQELLARQIGRRWIFRKSLLNRYAGRKSKRTTRLELATFGLGSDEGPSFYALCERLRA
jgi:excisionase family DNA binding protein